MAVIVIGAQASGLGKTSLICSLIAAMPERRWTAIKITQCSHQAGAENQCDCALGDARSAVGEEHAADACTDSSRYLAAGAVRSVWVRTVPGHLGKMMPRIGEEIAGAGDVVIESNSVMEFLKPHVYALIVSPCVADFKPSARRYLDRADAILVAAGPPGRRAAEPGWMSGMREHMRRIPQFVLAQPQLASAEFVAFVRDRMALKDPNPEL